MTSRKLSTSSRTWTRRILSRLETLELREPCPHLRDDYRIAWITLRNAARGDSQPFVAACYQVLGLHPDKIWPSIVERRKALLGPHYEVFYPTLEASACSLPRDRAESWWESWQSGQLSQSPLPLVMSEDRLPLKKPTRSAQDRLGTQAARAA